MDTQQALIAQMRAITISREYGSGGGEIAQRLAKKLHWQLVDHDFVTRIAQLLGVSEQEVELQDEYAQSLAARILANMCSVDPALWVGAMSNSNMLATTEEGYRQALTTVVQAVYEAGHVVIVGRGGQKVLAYQQDVVHIRIVAPLEKRITYVVEREGLDRDSARARIQQKDRSRERYLQANYHESNREPHLYDAVLNTSILDLTSITDIILFILERKASRLGIVAYELGPAAGSTCYPSQPQDFFPPISHE